MISTLSLKTKLTGAFAAVALITAVVGLVGYKGMSFARNAHDLTASVRLPATNALWMIKDGQDVARRVELVIFQPQLSDAERAGMRRNLQTAKDQAEQGIKAFETLPSNPESAALWKEFKAAWAHWEKINLDIIGAMERPGADRNTAYRTATGDSRVAFHEARVVLDKMIQQEMAHARKTRLEFEREYARTRNVTLGSVVLGAALAFGFGIYLSSSISAMLTRLADKASEISGGELRTRMPEEGYVELRALAGSFNAMADNLRTVIRQIQEAGGAVDAFSSDFTVVIQEQASASAQQAASLAEVTATMEELSRTSHQIAQNAQSVKESAAQTVEMAQQGTVLVREGVDGMSRIKERVNDIARKTTLLGDRSQEIGKVMDLIKEIAGEIHLLALNAAIESAAAGEHGRRFAVVASEVRRLAEKTRESTESIRSLVTEIQAATQGSILATEEGNREVDTHREAIRKSADAFEEIIGMIENTSEASTMISLATQQQTSANDQVASGMRQVAETVRLTAGRIKESSVSAAELKKMASRLTEKTSVFRV